MEANNFQQKRFEKLEDFNLIYINNFEKSAFPKIITGGFLKRYPEKILVNSFFFWKKSVNNPELPAEIFESGLGNVCISCNGTVYKKAIGTDGEIYYDSFDDATERIKKILNLPEIRNSVEALTGAVRKPVLSRDLLSLQGFQLVEHEIYGDISLTLKDDAAVGKNLRTCRIVLTNIKNSFLISLDLGILSYSVYRR